LYASQNNIRVDETKEDEIGEGHSMHEKDEKCTQNFDQRTGKEETTWKT
jgi:hypothetical protein